MTTLLIWTWKKTPKHSQVNGFNVPSEFNLLLYELGGRGRGINPVCSAMFPRFRGIGASKLVPRKLLMSSFCFTAHFASCAQQMSHTPVSKTLLKWGLVQWWVGGSSVLGWKKQSGFKTTINCVNSVIANDFIYWPWTWRQLERRGSFFDL